MEQQTFVGWVEHVYECGQYDQKICVANYRNETEKQIMINSKSFPMAYSFSASVKSGAVSLLSGIKVGDKVQVKFYVTGRSGISKNGKYYCINSLQIVKQNGLIIIEKSFTQNRNNEEPKPLIDDDDNVPF